MNGKALIFLRVCYWLGIILDARAAYYLLDHYLKGIGDVSFSSATLRDTGIAFALMAGWTILLFWADRKPVARKGILLLTVFPVLALLLANNLILTFNQRLTFQDQAVNIIGGVILLTLFTLAYILASVYLQKEEVS